MKKYRRTNLIDLHRNPELEFKYSFENFNVDELKLGSVVKVSNRAFVKIKKNLWITNLSVINNKFWLDDFNNKLKVLGIKEIEKFIIYDYYGKKEEENE